MNKWMDAIIDFCNKVLKLLNSIDYQLQKINKSMDLILQINVALLRHYNTCIKLFQTSDPKPPKDYPEYPPDDYYPPDDRMGRYPKGDQ